MINNFFFALLLFICVFNAFSCSKRESLKEKEKREKTYLEKTVNSYLEGNQKLKEAEKNLERQKKDYQEAETEAITSEEKKGD